MSLRNKQKSIGNYVSYHIRLPLVFTPAEERFVLHMVRFEKMKEMGLFIPGGRAEYMKAMQLTPYAFDRCIAKTIRLGLLTKKNNRKLNRVYYYFDLEKYKKLLAILSLTTDIEKLQKFCKTHFVEQCRSIESITKKELELLCDQA